MVSIFEICVGFKVLIHQMDCWIFFLLYLDPFDRELGIVCMAAKQYVGQFLERNECSYIGSHFRTPFLPKLGSDCF